MLLSKVLYHWNILAGNVIGDVACTLGDGVTTSSCTTSTNVGSNLGSDKAVGLVNYAVVGGVTFTPGSCNGWGFWTGESVGGVGAVQRYRASETFSKALLVVYPDSKLGVIDDGGLVSIEMI